MIYGVLLITLIILFIYIREVRKVKFDIRLIINIAIFSAIAFCLNSIKFIRMPQGGSIALFSMLPVMLISVIKGKGVGLTSGILLGLLKMLDGITFVHPLQFVLDYILSNMCFGFAGIFGKNSKFKIILGCTVSGILCITFNVLSGVLFFGEYVPTGNNVWVYSLIYNLSSIGVEVLLSIVVMYFIPIEKLSYALDKNIERK